jgi:hypothetical protein
VSANSVGRNTCAAAWRPTALLEELDWSIRPDESPRGNGSGYVVDCLRSARLAVAAGSYAEWSARPSPWATTPTRRRPWREASLVYATGSRRSRRAGSDDSAGESSRNHSSMPSARCSVCDLRGSRGPMELFGRSSRCKM